MFDIEQQVQQWRHDGLDVTIGRTVRTRGISSREPGRVAAWTADGAVVGGLFNGALDDQLRGLDGSRRIVELTIGEDTAERVGLSCGGVVELLVQPADDLPARTWPLLAAHEAVCLVTRLEADGPGTTETFERGAELAAPVRPIFRRGVSDVAVIEDEGGSALVTALWPASTLIVVGAGVIADALAANAALLGWVTERADDDVPEGEESRAARLTSADAIVVLSHNMVVSGRWLAAALSGGVGYIGALGSRHTQAARANWLVKHGGVTEDQLAAIHGPAGLDIGSNTPAEIALAIIAEIMATRAGRTGASLRDKV
ncbi:MAG: XdhC family protein [Actinobacteria bacterium]|nr:XdhC family protein [Actinomycetota bacterium]